ncbi:NADPH-adrenodoxin reductase [Mucor velutinosus]|uniref:NADPH-adrenodoxin reductase n=1 Tax=Mucor velutinosus TaxID=708070 RepID=A0AAN7D371_9FUNG|nr:NADPH-adrenodoxin reductase [Mucor velutinosus]
MPTKKLIGNPALNLIHNLKLLGFDDSKYCKGTFKLNKKLFTDRATNNDKALEYISLFLFRKVDKLRVKNELLPTLANGGWWYFIHKIFKWLQEIRRETDLFKHVPLRESELRTNQGVNLIKVMAAFSTYVIQSTMKHADVGKISTLPKAVIQDSIVQADQSSDLNSEVSSTHVSKATKATEEINAELSSSPPPPPPSPPSQNTIPLELHLIRRFNGHIGSIFRNPHSMLSNPVNHEPAVVEESFTLAPYGQPSSSVSFESLRALEESSTSVPIEQPRIVEETPTTVIPEHSETINESPSTVSVEQPSAVEESCIPAVPNHSDTLSIVSHFTDQPNFTEELYSSVHVEEPGTVATPEVAAEALSLNTATSSSSCPELGTTESQVPNVNVSNTQDLMNLMYYLPGSTEIASPIYIPQLFTPNQQRDVPDITMPYTASTTQNTSSRNIFNQFNYMTESHQLSFSHNPSCYDPGTASVLPPSSCTKRKLEQDDDQDEIVVPCSPPRQRRRVVYDDRDEGATTLTTNEMNLVPPLMSEDFSI